MDQSKHSSLPEVALAFLPLALKLALDGPKLPFHAFGMRALFPNKCLLNRLFEKTILKCRPVRVVDISEHRLHPLPPETLS